MKIYLMRHGEAGFEAATDKQRFLTTNGERQTAEVIEQFPELLQQVDLVLTSTYLRTEQTWNVIAPMCSSRPEVASAQELTPEANPQVARDLILAHAEVSNAKQVLVVSHMPLLGYLVAELVPGLEPSMFATSSVTEIEVGETARVSKIVSPQL